MLFRPGLVVHGAKAGQDLWSRARCTNEPHRVRNGRLLRTSHFVNLSISLSRSSPESRKPRVLNRTE